MEQQDPTKERITPKQLAKYLDWWIGTIDQTAAINGTAPAKRIVPILNGPSGVGKSALVFQAAERAGRKIIDLRGSQIDSVDVRGIPMPDAETRRMVYFTNGELPNAADDPDCTDLIFFDEFKDSSPSVLKASYQGISDHRFGDLVIPPRCAFVCAGNEAADRAFLTPIPGPLKDRLNHVYIGADLDSFVDHTIRNNWEPEIPAFVRFRPEYLHDHTSDPEADARASCRGWDDVNTVLKTTKDPFIRRIAIAGAQGAAAAAEFIGFLRVCESLPDPDSILNDPANAKVPDLSDSGGVATTIATVSMLARIADAGNYTAIHEYLKRLNSEFAVACVRDSISRNPDLTETPAYCSWAVSHPEIYTD